jgi:hypothetical protein
MKAMQSLEQILKRVQISKPIRTNDGYVKRNFLSRTLCKIEAYISGFQVALAFRELHRPVPPQNGVMTLFHIHRENKIIEQDCLPMIFFKKPYVRLWFS